MGRCKKDVRLRGELLRRVYGGQTDLEALAEAMGLELGELAKWAEDAEATAALRGLRVLADTQAQLIVSRYRVTAAAKLVQLANQEEDGELARKASVDLLKMNLMEEVKGKAVEPAAVVVDEKKVLAALRELGEGET